MNSVSVANIYGHLFHNDGREVISPLDLIQKEVDDDKSPSKGLVMVKEVNMTERIQPFTKSSKGKEVTWINLDSEYTLNGKTEKGTVRIYSKQRQEDPFTAVVYIEGRNVIQHEIFLSVFPLTADTNTNNWNLYAEGLRAFPVLFGKLGKEQTVELGTIALFYDQPDDQINYRFRIRERLVSTMTQPLQLGNNTLKCFEDCKQKQKKDPTIDFGKCVEDCAKPQEPSIDPNRNSPYYCSSYCDQNKNKFSSYEECLQSCYNNNN